MTTSEILKMVDHTNLSQITTWTDIKKLCDEGVKYGTASICIPPSYVKRTSKYLQNKIKICTVIGFPNGYATTNVKIYETLDALQHGADEIDMVINIGFVKSGKYDKQLHEIQKIKNACKEKILKVIIETCLLSDYEKKKMCEIVTMSGADFIKTSTGFSTYGATAEDVALLRKYTDKHVQVKAAGGISSFDDAEKFISLGATRLGTSKLVKILTQQY